MDKIEEEQSEEEKEIIQLKKCMREKDKRISKLEDTFSLVRNILITIWYSVIVTGSYLLWMEAWTFIGTNGKWHIQDLFGNVFTPSKTIIPYALTNDAGMVLAIVMMILFGILSFLWAFWFVAWRD